MKLKLYLILPLITSCLAVFCQDFTGYVLQNDSLAKPVYQATVQVVEAGHSYTTLKTYFDGSFKFTPLKNEAYTFKISCIGYCDTSMSIITDRKGIPTPATITVRLKKDGMRLTGIIKNVADSLPLKDVTVVIKNIMTRKTDRQTTTADGYYNIKLEYETNYRVSIDKYSKGIFNKYRDTSFYISTIGFNLPIDYPLNINLVADPTLNNQMPDGYDAAAIGPNTNLKPIVFINDRHGVPVAGKGRPALIAANPSKPSGNINAIQPDAVQPYPVAIAASGKKPINDSLEHIRLKQKLIADQMMARKEKDDSLAQARIATSHAKELQEAVLEVQQATREYERQDSIERSKAKKNIVPTQQLAKKAARETENRSTATVEQKEQQDSIRKVQTENKRIAQQVVAEFARKDSLLKARLKAKQDSARTAKQD